MLLVYSSICLRNTRRFLRVTTHKAQCTRHTCALLHKQHQYHDNFIFALMLPMSGFCTSSCPCEHTKLARHARANLLVLVRIGEWNVLVQGSMGPQYDSMRPTSACALFGGGPRLQCMASSCAPGPGLYKCEQSLGEFFMASSCTAHQHVLAHRHMHGGRPRSLESAHVHPDAMRTSAIARHPLVPCAWRASALQTPRHRTAY
jgi:hypothetical protein